MFCVVLTVFVSLANKTDQGNPQCMKYMEYKKEPWYPGLQYLSFLRNHVTMAPDPGGGILKMYSSAK